MSDEFEHHFSYEGFHGVVKEDDVEALVNLNCLKEDYQKNVKVQVLILVVKYVNH